MTERNHEIGALDAKVELLLSAQMRVEDRLEAVRQEVIGLHQSHSRRLGSLERSRAWLAGAIAVLGALWATATAWLAGWAR